MPATMLEGISPLLYQDRSVERERPVALSASESVTHPSSRGPWSSCAISASQEPWLRLSVRGSGSRPGPDPGPDPPCETTDVTVINPIS